MALSQRLDLRQSQSLVMTPQLQQAIKLLQFSNMELAEYVDGELQQNPLLERDDGDSPAMSEVVASDNQAAYDAARDKEAAPREDGDGRVSEERVSDAVDGTAAETIPATGDDPNDTDYDNNWGSADIRETDFSEGPSAGLSNFTSSSRGGFDDDERSLEQTLGDDKTLRQHLWDQFVLDVSDPTGRFIGGYLIDLVDDAGYLTADLDEAAEALGCERAEVDIALSRIQALDPAGVAARDLSECLALQLKDRNRLDPAMQALLDNLPMLAKRETAKLMVICGVDSEDMIEMIEEIRALDPKPGLAFEPSVESAVVPDVLMRPTPDGAWSVELNPETLPRVLVNNTYYAKVSKQNQTKEDKEYVNECFQSANWLVRSLHQRATTIMKVSSEIIRQQGGFFRHGVQHLRPLVLRDIAEAIGMHESTVSRVTSNKYIATPRGIYELKYFFTSAIASSAGGDAFSAEAVRFRIKALIDGEPPEKVLSDDRIVEILREQGVDIARRTVAKYREAMQIPSSVQRRREKSLRIA